MTSPSYRLLLLDFSSYLVDVDEDDDLCCFSDDDEVVLLVLLLVDEGCCDDDDFLPFDATALPPHRTARPYERSSIFLP